MLNDPAHRRNKRPFLKMGSPSAYISMQLSISGRRMFRYCEMNLSRGQMTRAWEPPAKCEVIFARALSAFAGELADIPRGNRYSSRRIPHFNLTDYFKTGLLSYCREIQLTIRNVGAACFDLGCFRRECSSLLLEPARWLH